jgi:hypothetical protein
MTSDKKPKAISVNLWEDISIENIRSLGPHTQQMEVHSFLDVRKVGLTTARWMLLRKKVHNFGDILSTVKRNLLADNATSIPQQDVNTQVLELLRSPSPFLDDDTTHSSTIYPWMHYKYSNTVFFQPVGSFEPEP